MRGAKGQTSLELVIALAIFSTVAATVIILIYGGQMQTAAASQSYRALALARASLEEAGATARLNFAGLTTSADTLGEFSRTLAVETVGPNTKKATVTVSWSSILRSFEVHISEIFTDWRGVLDRGGDTGGGGTSGDWQNPHTLDSLDLGPGNEATDLDVLDRVIYLTADASDPKKEDFFAVDATDGSNVYVVGGIDTGGGLNAVDVASGTAYVANTSSDDQLLVLDVSSFRSTTTVLASFDLPGVNAVAQAIYYDAGRVYMGTQSAAGPEFHIVDVSNPASPSSLGSFEVSADINSIQVLGEYAYLATSDNSRELRILNISDPSAISDAGYFDPTGNDDALALHMYGNTLYLGRKQSAYKEFYVVDVSAAASPSLLGSAEVGADVTGIRVRDSLGFLGTSDSNKEFQVWNIASSTAMSLWSSFNFPQVATGIDYEDNLVYVSVRSNDAVRIITSGP